MTVQFQTVTVIGAPAELVYELALSVEVHVASMAGHDEVTIGGRRSGIMDRGDEVTWRARPFGVRFTMTSLVSAAEPPLRFVDEQVRGPFAAFRHDHRFATAGRSTAKLDHVRFDAPLGVLGDVVEIVLLRRYVTSLIGERNAYLKEAAEAEPTG